MRYLLIALLCAGCIDKTGQSASYVLRSTLDTTRERVRDLEKDLTLERARIAEMEERAEVARRRLADSGATLETFLEEMARLRGELSDINFRLQEKGQLDEDMDFRLTALESRLGWMQQSLNVPAPPPEWGRPRPTPTPPAAVASPGPVVDEPVASLPEEPAPHDPDAALFAEARALFDGGQFDRAGGRLQAYLKAFPQGASALEARFLIASCLFELGRFKPAIIEYQKVIDAEEANGRRDDATWAPRAMLQQGRCFEGLGTAQNRDEARLFYEELLRLYPSSAAADDARGRLDALR